MAKKPKSRRGEGDQVSGEEAKEKVTEVDREWFQIQIKALEEKLQRRTDKMQLLEASYVEFKEKYEQAKEDKADVVAYLKRMLQQRLDQISELQARLEGLQQVHEADQKSYELKLEQLKQEAARTKEELVSEKMVLAKKLDALEEFRIQREQLLTKFDDQEKLLAKMTADHERKLEQQEKKHILEEDRLKKEMLFKLESVAAEFRRASHAQMAATTQRTIRENVGVSAHAQQMADALAEVTTENEKLTELNRRQRRTIESLEVEQKRLIKGNTYKLKVIEELSARCQDHAPELKKLSLFHQERRQYESLIQRQKSELEQLHQALHSNVSASKEKEGVIADISAKLDGVAKNKDVINTCLEEASGAIRTALAFQNATDPCDEAEMKLRREGVLNQLLLMLNTAAKDKDEEGGDMEYLHGSLGLVPVD